MSDNKQIMLFDCNAANLEIYIQKTALKRVQNPKHIS
jgi:hypothetical protein